MSSNKPFPSSDLDVFKENSLILDNFVNSQENEHPDRFARKRPTITGIIKEAFNVRTDISNMNETLIGQSRWDAVPKNTSLALGGDNGALNKQAQALFNRTELLKTHAREALRRTYLEAGLNLVEGSFEAGGTLVKANDVLLQERTGRVFSGPVGVVAAGTDPASGEFVDRSSVLLRDMSQKIFSTTAAVISAAATLKIGDLVSTAGHTTVGVGAADYVVSTDIARPFLDISLGDGRIAKMLIKEYIDPASCGVDTTGVQPASLALAEISKHGSISWIGSLYIDQEFIFAAGNDLIGQGQHKSKLLFKNSGVGKGIVKSTRSRFYNFGVTLKDFLAPFDGQMITVSVQYDYYIYGTVPRESTGYDRLVLDHSSDIYAVSTGGTSPSGASTGRFLVLDTGDINGIPIPPLATQLGIYKSRFDNCTAIGFYCPLTLLSRTDRANQGAPWMHSNRFAGWVTKNNVVEFEALIQTVTPRAGSFTDNKIEDWVTQPYKNSQRIATMEGAGFKFVDCFFWDQHLYPDQSKLIVLRKSATGDTNWIERNSFYNDHRPSLEFVRCPITRNKISVENMTTNLWPAVIKITDKFGNGDCVGDIPILSNITTGTNISRFMAVNFTTPQTVGAVAQCTFKIKSKWPLATDPFRGAIYAIDIAINVKLTATGFEVKTHLLTPYTGIKTGIDIYADNPRLVNGEYMLDIVASQNSVAAPFPSIRLNDSPLQNGDWQLSNSYGIILPIPSGHGATTLSDAAVKIVDTLDLIAANTVISKTTAISI
ncbi:hypothetical protein PS2_0169 [Aeromonas phage PS2]|uniref:Uncharacterized protein n=1 Tax=Aeromonas phage PS1 TaxID=2591406 RepID=A0A514TUI0_9CAUD|nr:hypothetical protein PQC64_gp098 [Aeromonas phage PS1]QDJ96676.1 hypothetical protein PS1_0165 [Aeromonas phage PS1]QFR59310.1 hypothetical protein PS2_0169 [Aeromonas phage PS2]